MEYKHLLVRQETGDAIKSAAKERGMTMVDYVEYLFRLDVGDPRDPEQFPLLTEDEIAQYKELSSEGGITTISVDKRTSLLLGFLVIEDRMNTTKSEFITSLVIQKLNDWGILPGKE